MVTRDLAMQLYRAMLRARLAEEMVVQLYPELTEPGAEINPMVLETIQRLAERHEQTSELFSMFRERLGIPAPEEPEDSADGEPPEEPEEPGDPGGGE